MRRFGVVSAVPVFLALVLAAPAQGFFKHRYYAGYAGYPVPGQSYALPPWTSTLLQQYLLPQIGHLINPQRPDDRKPAPPPRITISSEVTTKLRNIQTAVNKIVDKTNLLDTGNPDLEKLKKLKDTGKTKSDGEETKDLGD
jgi:hypothetical protein